MIRIEYGRLLDGLYRKLFTLSPENAGKEFPSPEAIQAKEDGFIAAWKPMEERILNAMCDVLDLEFFQNAIDVHLVVANSSMSKPMLIGLRKNDPAGFVATLTHELIHRLLTDNTRHLDVRKIWSEMYPDPEMPRLTRVHILVHAVHQYIYLDVLKDPASLERNIAKDRQFPEYLLAWEVVQRDGYRNIIDRFKSYYANDKE